MPGWIWIDSPLPSYNFFVLKNILSRSEMVLQKSSFTLQFEEFYVFRGLFHIVLLNDVELRFHSSV